MLHGTRTFGRGGSYSVLGKGWRAINDDAIEGFLRDERKYPQQAVKRHGLPSCVRDVYLIISTPEEPRDARCTGIEVPQQVDG